MVMKIILPTDFSENSWNAISYVIQLFKYNACEFHVVHTYTPNTYANDNMMTAQFGQMQLENLKENSTVMLNKLSRKIAVNDVLPHHNFHYHSKFNLLVETLEEMVQTTAANLIVMGTKGATDSIDVLLGGNTIKVMEKIRSCPVLMIPTDAQYEEIKEIVFPTGFKMPYKAQEIEFLTALANKRKALISVLYMGDKDDLSAKQLENKKILEGLLRNSKFKHHNIDDVDVQTGLHCFVQSRNSNMIAFVNKKHNFFDSLFKRPLVKELGYHSKLPVLALHN